MTDMPDGLGARLEQALRSHTNRGALLREMEQLSQETTFSFSSDQSERAAQMLSSVRRIIEDEHFVVNTAKTHVARPHTRQMVTGLVVNEALSIPRPLRRKLRAILHNAGKDGLAAQNRAGHPNSPAYLAGMIAFIRAANPRHAAALQASLDRLQVGPAASQASN